MRGLQNSEAVAKRLKLLSIRQMNARRVSWAVSRRLDRCREYLKAGKHRTPYLLPKEYGPDPHHSDLKIRTNKIQMYYACSVNESDLPENEGGLHLTKILVDVIL